MGTFMWNVLLDEVPEALQNHFSIRKRDYGNQNLKFHLPFGYTGIFKRGIVYQVTKLWNFRPSDIRGKKRSPTFKAAYNNYLLHNQTKDISLLILMYFLFI